MNHCFNEWLGVWGLSGMEKKTKTLEMLYCGAGGLQERVEGKNGFPKRKDIH